LSISFLITPTKLDMIDLAQTIKFPAMAMAYHYPLCSNHATALHNQALGHPE
jgi:hypothetical protein